MKDFMQQTLEEREAHQNAWGGFNDFPPGWRKIEPDFYWIYNQLFIRSGFFTEYRQMYEKVDGRRTFSKPYVEAQLFFTNDNAGFAVVANVREKSFSWYAFGCDHKYEGVVGESRMCYHVSRCKLCGHRLEVDSSD